MNRVCRRCKVEKDETQFGFLKCSKDGINPRCRQCCCDSVKRSKKSPEAIANKKKYVAEWQKRNKDRNNAKCRRWYERNLEKAREMSLVATKKYHQTENGRKKRTQRGTDWEKKNPEKRSAHDRAMYAVKTGKLVRPSSCEKCCVVCKPHAHHEDYSKPLDVVWLCAKCHFYLHHGYKHHRKRLSEEAPKGDAKVCSSDESGRGGVEVPCPPCEFSHGQ